jgi:electron transport complex protein RnfD
MSDETKKTASEPADKPKDVEAKKDAAAEPEKAEQKPAAKADEKAAENKKADGKAEEKKAEPKAEEKKGDGKAEEKKAEPKAEEKKAEPKAEEKKVADKPAEKAADKPAEKAADKPAEKAADKPAAKPAARKPAAPPPEDPPLVHVAPSPHVADIGLTTRGLMFDVVLGLALVVVASVWYFGWQAVRVLAITTVACMAFEWLFVKMSGREPTLADMSAVVTGLILALSFPWSTPWWICVIAAGIAMGIGKVAFGSLGQNLFNPAMVGRAFVMISFSAYMGAGAYVDAKGMAGTLITQATPLTAIRTAAPIADWWFLFIGNTNGSLGETSALASLLGGLYLCFRRTASWEIPVSMIGTMVVLTGAVQLLAGPDPALMSMKMTVLQHLLSGAFMFGTFFIATDPVTSPLSMKGKFYYGAGISFFIWLLRVFSNYPEGLMFAVLLMNSAVPLINRWTVPVPVGGPVPERN